MQTIFTYDPAKPPIVNDSSGIRTISEDSFFRECLGRLREKTRGAPIPLKACLDPGALLTKMGLQVHNRTPWAWGWQDTNPPPAPKPGPNAVPAEQIARKAGLVSRTDMEEAVRMALPAPTVASLEGCDGCKCTRRFLRKANCTRQF